ncbi:hypothetical protein AM501_19470 [Aneurinibacillus migulanus]|uniref:Uncharacterized protein n=1 Tax=Aneurinibacillus migulanus TaxID=47500 RepID=A0A0D1XI13_ANEMI|nr:hypothetical protein [Aneurinibacillus migulanus]KIV51898.1 hypothetical protein TS65_25390 [Aneurinibacillus migulanus]KIV54405.1 hypothetical protein TS64_15230 [Aneurinibacillus migulanus]KON98020.1 hypothetical protein AF333_23870 [Aneurinibacillus migulanus]KPD06800.1 hypothetical protein AM501_19470 [Aneurinibacillus migulanus]MCP1354195.1 hypothetical protein [Aneurinibacillus migulanus]
MRRTEESAYEKRFTCLARRVETCLVVAIVAGWVLLIVSQALLTYEPVRYWLVETVRMEGVASP